MRREMNILAMARGAERYVFLYDDDSYDALLNVFDRFASEPELNFSDADAALLADKARECRSRSVDRGYLTPRDQ